MKRQLHRCEKGCGRIVSANKSLCLACDRDQTAFDERKNEQPMEDVTHIIVRHKSVDQEDLYRADGMLVASRQKDIVRFGSDISTAQDRPFLSPELGSQFMKRLADVDLVAAAEGKPIHAVIDRYPSAPAIANVEYRDLEAKVGIIIPRAIRLANY